MFGRAYDRGGHARPCGTWAPRCNWMEGWPLINRNASSLAETVNPKRIWNWERVLGSRNAPNDSHALLEVWLYILHLFELTEILEMDFSKVIWVKRIQCGTTWVLPCSLHYPVDISNTSHELVDHLKSLSNVAELPDKAPTQCTLVVTSPPPDAGVEKIF